MSFLRKPGDVTLVWRTGRNSAMSEMQIFDSEDAPLNESRKGIKGDKISEFQEMRKHPSLNSWDYKFLTSIINYLEIGFRLSAKQLFKIESIRAKIRESELMKYELKKYNERDTKINQNFPSEDAIRKLNEKMHEGL